MRKIACLALGVFLCAAGGWMIWHGHDRVDVLQALHGDPASPYRWCEVGEARALPTGVDRRYCFQRAKELGPNIPPVWMREANFHLEGERREEMLAALARVLSLTSEYDAVVFVYCDRSKVKAVEFLSLLKGDQRGATAYFRYILAGGATKASDASDSWEWLRSQRFVDDRLAADYVGYLLHNGFPGMAPQVWSAYLGSRAGGYPAKNRLFNGGFEAEFSGGDLDWKTQPVDGAETVRDSTAREGQWALKIQFAGTQNVDYAHTLQTVVIGPGKYVLRYWIRTENVTTDQGIGVHLYDAEMPARLDVTGEQPRGTHDWTLIEKTFSVGRDTRLLRVELRRNASLRLDNKISGSVWIDSISIAESF